MTPPLGSVVRILDHLQPRPRLTVSEWADRNRVIPPGTSPEPGPWRTERVPYLRGIQDAINDSTIETVVVMVASQLGKSEALLNILGYFVDQDPAPVLMVQPTIEAMESFSKERIEPTFRASPVLRGKLETGLGDRGSSRKSSQTIRLKQFPGGYLAMAGANAPAGLSSRPIRIVLFDELDRFHETAGIEGDPVRLAVQRTANFHNRKILMVSTPSIDGISKIQEWYLLGDQRQYQVPCPHCGVMQVFQWERLVYKNAAGERDLSQTHYVCEVCNEKIEEREKPAMLAAGQWIAQQPGRKIASFGDLSALYSPWAKWATLAEEWCKVQDARDRRGLQEFVNLKLGQPWVEHQQIIAVEYLERRREYYGETLPDPVLILTAGVDVQDDRLELEILGWGVGRQSWGVRYQQLLGDPGRPEVWQQLDGVLAEPRATADGRRLFPATVAIDSGGHHTSEVYEYCRAREARRVWAIKGRGGEGIPAIGKGSRGNRFHCALIPLGVDGIKGEVMARLRLDNPGPGHCHFPREPERGYDRVYFDGLLSEQRVVKQRGGSRKVEWKKLRDRNEPLDCRVYATAALEILSPNLELLAEQVARAAESGGAARHGASKGRRIISKGLVL
jgi:phage terminase large subunit GpA-like protein